MAKRNRGINIFRQVPKANLPSTTFNMSHSVKFDGEFGVAYPIFCEEVIAGDTWDIAVDHFARLNPMPAPVMHDFDVRFHWFFVPCRLLWNDFEDWITGGRTGTWREDNPDSFPTFNLHDVGYCLVAGTDRRPTGADLLGTLWDFIGIDVPLDYNFDVNATLHKFNCMPSRAYWLIWNYFFRDQNITPELEIDMVSGLDSLEFLQAGQAIFGRNDGLFKVAWDKDYFTSATLSPQRGPQVFVPIGAQAPVKFNVESSMTPARFVYQEDGSGINTQGDSGNNIVVADSGMTIARTYTNAQEQGLQTDPNVLAYDPNGSLIADLSSAQGAAVDDVREAFALQRFFERMQVVGSRFAEYLRGIFGTNAGDARLQMPEYLGSWQNPFMINNVSQTSATSGTSPQAGFAGNGMSSQRNAPIRKWFSEPGYLIGLYVAMPRNGYMQGIPKKMMRTDWLDWFNPYFEHIGEQPIMTSELYFDPAVRPEQDKVFGYQSQYASYKFINSHVHGQFKNTLDFWTAARKFDEAPTLSAEFIYFNKEESTDRVFTLMDEPKFEVHLDVKAFATRPISAYSTPRLM